MMHPNPDQSGPAQVRFGRRSLLRPAIPAAAIAAVGGLTAVGGTRPAYAADGDPCVEVMSLADLRANSGTDAPRAVLVDDIAVPGVFLPDRDDTETADNAATTVVTGAGTRYHRLAPAGHLDVCWFGAVGDAETDDTDAIEAAIAEAAARRKRRRSVWLGEGRPEVNFPIALGYRTTRPIRVPVGIDIAMDADIIADFTGDVALEIGEEGEFNRQVRARVRVTSVDPVTADWSDEATVGVRLISAETGRFDIALVDGFTIGLQCIGIGQGFAYNHVELGRIPHNRIGVELTCRSFNNRIGWACENLFLGGRWQHNSSSHKGQERIGVRITAQDDGWTLNDNNNFVKPSFELRAVDANPAVARGILIEHGSSNSFTAVRDEGNTRPLAQVLNDSIENSIETGYGFAFVDDQSYSRSTFTRTRRRKIMQTPLPIAQVGPLNEVACYYDGDQLIQIPGMAFADPATGELTVAGQATLVDGGVRVEAETDHGPSLRVSTTRHYRFVVRRETASGEGGRVHVIAYDKDGARLNDPGTGEANAWVRTISEYPIGWDPDLFGGCYVTRPDHGEDMLISFRDEVDSVQVIFWRGTGPLTLNGIAIQAVDSGLTSWSSGIEGSTVSRTDNVALQPPTKGTWPRGKIIYNAEPPTGPRPRAIGWQKVTDGDSNVAGTDWVSVDTMAG